MADINKEIVSFDVDTDNAVRQVDAYIVELEKLEKEQRQLQKAGKDTAAVNLQIEKTARQLQKALLQETTTLKGLQKQTEAQAKAAKVLANAQKDNAAIAEKSAKSNVQLATSLARAGGRITNLGGAIGAAVGGLASFTGAAELGGFALAAITTAANKAFAALDNYLFPVNKATELSQQLASDYINEAANLAQLSNIITDTTTKTDDRTRAINALNEQYGQYLPNLLTEKSTNEEVAAAIQLVNDKIIEGIIARGKQAEATKQIEIIAQESIRLANLETDASVKRNTAIAQTALGTAATVFGGVLGGYLSTTETASNATSAAIEGVTRASIQANIDAAQKNLDNLDNTFKEVEKNLRGVKLESLAAASDITTSGLKQAEIAEKNAEKLKEQSKTAKKENTLLEGSLAALEKKLSDLSKVITETPLTSNQLPQLGQQYQTLQKEVEKARDAVAALKGEVEEQKIVEIDAARAGKIDRIEKRDLLESEKAIKELIAEIDADTTTNTAEQRQNELDKLQLEISQLNVKKQLLELEKQSTAEVDKQIAVLTQQEAQLAALIPLQNTLEAQTNQITALEIQKLKAQTDPQKLAIEEQILQKRLQALQTERQIAALQGQNTLEIDKQIALLENEISAKSEERVKERGEKLKENFAEVLGGIENIGNQSLEYLSVITQAQIAQIDKAIDATRSKLDELTNTQENVSAQQIQIEQERLDKLLAQRQAAADKEALIAKIQIAAQTAVTIARAAAEGGGIGSAITIAAALASLVFGFSQAQIAAENSFYEGTTYVPLGRNKRGRDTIPAMLHEGEAVIPTATNAEYKDAVEAIYHKEVPADILNDFAKNWKSKGLTPNVRGNFVLGVAQSDNTPILKQIAKNTAQRSEQKVLLTRKGIVTVTTGSMERKNKLALRNK